MNNSIVTKEQASFTELLDQREAIILDLENLHYYTLNAPAIFLWKELYSGATRAADGLTDSLAAAFNINRTQAESDTRAFLAALSDNGLIAYGDTAPPAKRTAAAAPPHELPAYEPPQLKLSNSLLNVTLSGSSTIATAAIATGG